MIPVSPVDTSVARSVSHLLRRSLPDLGTGDRTAVVLATEEPFRRAALSAALPWLVPTAPAEADLGERQATALLQRVKPALVIVDGAESELARTAEQLGIAVALAGERPGELEPLATARQWTPDGYPAGTALLLQTTGTTGAPKLVGLSRHNIEASTAGIAETLALGPEDRTATLMPLTHIHGMVAVLLAGLSSGGRVIPIAPRDPSALWRGIDEIAPTWLSMVPTLLQALLESAPRRKPDALGALRFIRTSSSALPLSLRRRAEDYFEIPVVEAYGMTEACHQMASARPDDSLPGCVGRPSPGVEIAVMTPGGDAAPAGESGEICVKGRSVMAGYLWPADANETAFHEAWFRTGDLGRLDAEGRLWLTGRIKEQINRGGESLAPTEIDEVLLSHPQIAEAVAFPLPHPTLGEEVAALCVRAPGSTLGAHDVILHAAERLPFAHAPKTVFFEESIPRQASSGKVSRLAIAELYRSRDGGKGKTADRHSPWRAKLRRYLAEILGHGDFDDDTSVFAVGANSLHVVQLLARLEKEEGVSLPLASALTHQSVEALASLLAERASNAHAAPKVATGEESFPANPAIAGLMSAEHLYPHPLRNRAAVLMRIGEAFTAEDVAAAWVAVLRSQPALRAFLKRDDETGARVEVKGGGRRRRLRMLDVAATAEELERAGESLPEVSAFLTAEDGKAEGRNLVRAAILKTSEGTRFLLCQVHEALADGYGQCLLPALIESALLGRPLPEPSPLRSIMGSDSTPPSGRAPDGAPSEQLHEDGGGQRMQLAQVTERPLKAALWQGVDREARARATTRFAMAATLFAILVNRLAGAATPVWCASQRRRDARDFATLGSAAALMRLDLEVADDGAVVTLARKVMSRLFAAIERGDQLLPAFDRPLYIFEVASEALDLEAIRPDLTIGEGVGWYRRLRSGVPVASLELSINPPVGEADGSFQLTFDSGRFTKARAAALLEAYGELLEALAANPDAKVGDLALARDYESLREHPMPAGTEIGALADKPRDLIGLFDAILTRWPDERAAVWQDGSMTFAELDAAAQRLCQVLRDEGARPRDIIAFRMSADATAAIRVLYLVAQLAAFRLRCVFLPLGQLLPAARARDEIERLGVRFLLASKQELDCAPGWADARSHADVPDCAQATLLRRPGEAAAPFNLPEAAAVLMTTSGSTGVPKTIIDSQEMLLGFIEGMVKSGVVPPVSGLMGANIGVDACFYDFWVAWVFGRWTVLLETQRRTPDSLRKAAALGAKAVTLTPTITAAALRDDRQCFDGYAFLLMGGEPLPQALVQDLAEAAPDLVSVNPYGSTEAAVCATFWTCTARDGAGVSAGLAIPGYRAVIADPKDMRPLPRHWAGEILLSCPGPALGYLDAELTRYRFVDLPGWPGERFFRTADLGWIDDSGDLHVVGRIDRQTKVSGVRIELDEIERIVHDVAGVAEVGAFVIDRRGQERVEIVVEPTRSPPEEGLREQILLNCRKWLPRAAVPARVVFLDAMPLGDSGKKSHKALRALLDEAALASPGQDASGARGEAPTPGSTEAKLARLWTRLFRSHGFDPGRLSAASDVIDLGATSLDMLRIVARIEKAFGVRFPDEQIYLRPTLSAQAALIDQLRQEAPRPARRKAGGKGEFLELVRRGSGQEESGPVVIAMPGAHGRTSFLGPIGAHGFPNADLYRIAADLPAASSIDPEVVAHLVERMAEAILSRKMERRAILVGYSLGGWLAWLTDRLLTDKGHGQRPLINLDGGALHLRYARLQRPVEQLFPGGPSATRSRMLLVHRAEPKKAGLGDLAVREWLSMDEVSCSFIPVPTVDHGDVKKADLLDVLSPMMRRYVDAFPEDFFPEAYSHRSDAPGYALFEMLARPSPPSPQALNALVGTIPDQATGRRLRQPLLYLALAAGDATTAERLLDRMLEEDTDFREGAYARISLLVALGRKEEARQLVEDWLERHPQNQSFAKCLDGAEPRPATWHDLRRVTRLSIKLIDSLVAAMPAKSKELSRIA